MTNEMDPLRKLKELLAAAAEPLGLELKVFSVMVGDDGDSDHVQTMFAWDRTKVAKTVEDAHYDAAFDQLMKGQQAAELDDKANEAKTNLENLLRQNKGFLEDT